MTGKKYDEVLNMSQRTVLQYLSLTDWKLVNRLPIPAGELILSRLAHHVGSRSEVRSNIRKSDSPRRGSRRCGRMKPSAGS